MRSNIFLHFLNRDSREIYGLYKSQSESAHRQALLHATNAAVLLCEDHCVIPPGFAVECDIAFSLLEEQSVYLRNRLIQMPMREAGLPDFAEKKRHEYGAMRGRYRGLFSDRRLTFLAANAEGLVPRKAKIGEVISKRWAAAPDSRGRIWQPVKERLSAGVIEVVRNIPQQLLESDTAVTWSAIQPVLPKQALIASEALRNSLQHIYFKTYMDEFNLVVLRGAPLMHLDFMLRSDESVYSFDRFRRFLRAFSLHRLLLGASADVISSLKSLPGTITFLDAYADLGRFSRESTATVEFAAGLAAEEAGFNWRQFAVRHEKRRQWSQMEVLELAHALQEAALLLQNRYGLKLRGRSSVQSGWNAAAKLRIAFLSASPFDEDSVRAGKYRIATDKEFRDLEQTIKALPTAGQVELKLFAAADFAALLRVLNEFKPDIIHFSGHGWAGGLLMDTASMQESGGMPVPFDSIAKALEATSAPPRLVVLNACNTASGAQRLLSAVPVVVAMEAAIGDEAAYRFSQTFYGAVCTGQTVTHAKEQACILLGLFDAGAASLPTILTRGGAEAAHIALI